MRIQSFAILLGLTLVALSCGGNMPNRGVGHGATCTEQMAETSTTPCEAQAEPEPALPYEVPVWQVAVDEIRLDRMGYTLSYNPEELIPHWVAWELNSERLIERESRSDNFSPDPDLDPRTAVTTYEYKGSGWDRGHMSPAGDNRWHWRAMDESFYMTNICPQNGSLNRGDWKELEEACRRWAAVEPVYIVCGPILYATPKYGYIGHELDIRIPDAFFKVVLTGVESGKPRAIGFIYKNEACNQRMDKYVNSIDQVERITQLDFFSALDDDVERRVEAECDLALWQ